MRLTAEEVVAALADALAHKCSPLIPRAATARQAHDLMAVATRLAARQEWVRAAAYLRRAYLAVGGPWESVTQHGYLWAVRRHPIQLLAYGEPDPLPEVPF